MLHLTSVRLTVLVLRAPAVPWAGFLADDADIVPLQGLSLLLNDFPFTLLLLYLGFGALGGAFSFTFTLFH